MDEPQVVLVRTEVDDAGRCRMWQGMTDHGTVTMTAAPGYTLGQMGADEAAALLARAEDVKALDVWVRIGRWFTVARAHGWALRPFLTIGRRKVGVGTFTRSVMWSWPRPAPSRA